jgi:mannan endo-1,4-beta-mannosidase
LLNAPECRLFHRWKQLANRLFAASFVASLVVGAAAVIPTAATTTAAASAPIYWGSYVNGAPGKIAAINQFEADAGKKQSIVHWGQAWQWNGAMQPFLTKDFEAIRLRGSIPMVNWDSWSLGDRDSDPNYTLARIYNGSYDAYITAWAQDAKAWGHPFFVRFDHEMNGSWYPWSEQTNGNQPGDYVKAWRHVVDIFRSVGATNATWVWCVNIASDATTPMADLYPGDSYVDWLGMDGYNKATDTASWLSSNQIFGMHPWSKHNTYQELVNLAPSKPIMIAETSTTTSGGNAGAWITDLLLTQLPKNFPQVKALVWFNSNDGISTFNYKIESTPAQQAAFRQGIGSSYYASNTFALLPPGPVKAIGASPVPPAAGPTRTPTPVPPTATPTRTATPVPPTATPTATAVPTVVKSISTTVTLLDIGDSYVDGSRPDSTAGGPSLSLIADGNPYTVPFLRWDLSSLAGKTITAATLRIHTTTDVGAGSNASFDVMYVLNNAWQGSTMSMNKSVPISTTRLGTLDAPSQGGTWYQTGLLASGVQVGTGGLFSIALRNWTDPDGVIFNSKEGDPAVTPQLIITYK